MRVFLYLKFDGSKFHGFQEQSDKSGVMDALKFAANELGLGKPIGSSRTDRGVHAQNQVAHIDVPPFWEDLKRLQNALNRLLFPSICVRRIIKVADTAHARYDAQKRLYRYIFYTGEYEPILNSYALHIKNIDLKAANNALSLFKGTHDFGYFKKSGSPTSSDVRTLFEARAYRYKNFIVFKFLGDGFLRSQVRMMSAAVLAVTDGNLSLENLARQIEKKERYITKALEGGGLYLCRVHYNLHSVKIC